MSLRRFVSLFVLALVGEVGVFAFSNRELLYLRKPVQQYERESPAFVENAGQALTRSHLTRQHLETIAAAAQRLSQAALELRALERLCVEYPDDTSIQLRLADALRRARQFERAEQMYRSVLAATHTATP